MRKIPSFDYSNDILSRSWASLRPYFNVTLLKFLVTWFAIVPVAVRITADFPSTTQLRFFDPPVIVHFSLPFRWWLLWLSSLFYILAMVSFLLFCPDIVGSHPKFADYKRQGNTKRFILWKLYENINHINKPRFFDWLKRKSLAEIDPNYTGDAEEKPTPLGDETIYAPKYESNNYIIKMKNNEKFFQKEEELYWAIQENVTDYSPKIRFLITSALNISLVLFSIAVLQSIWTVLKFMAGS